MQNSRRVMEFDKQDGRIRKVEKLPANPNIQKQYFGDDYPEWAQDRPIKYQVEFYKDGKVYWDVDVRTESEFAEIENIGLGEVYGDYYIHRQDLGEDEVVDVFNIKTKKYAWTMTLKNGDLDSSENKIYVEGNDFYFVTDRGGVIYIKSEG